MFKPIAFFSKFWPLFTLLLIIGCGTSKEFAGDGRFVKRSLRPGWHVDLGIRKNRAHPPTLARETQPNVIENQWNRTYDRSTPCDSDEMLASTGNQVPLAEEYPNSLRSGTVTDPQLEWLATNSNTDQVTEQEDLMPKKKWNHWAIPSLLAALATVFLAFTTLEFIAVIVGIVVTLTFAGIALRRGRVHELAGKGFAIAALLIGVLAALVTVISVASYGF